MGKTNPMRVAKIMHSYQEAEELPSPIAVAVSRDHAVTLTLATLEDLEAWQVRISQPDRVDAPSSVIVRGKIYPGTRFAGFDITLWKHHTKEGNEND